jgi:prepilin-type processing-associated H-X9-DG protein
MVEMLVVIGILSVLASMLVPAANRLISLGKQTRCASNMRQLSAAIFAYAADHDGFFPAAPGDGESGAKWLAYWMLPFNDGCSQIDYEHGQLWQYLDRNGAASNNPQLTTSARYQIFNCPADDDNPRLSASGGNSLWPRNFTYSFNLELRQRPVGGVVGWRYGVRLTEVARPNRKIMTVEEQWPNDGYAVLGWVDETSGGFNTTNPVLNRCTADVLSARHNGLGNQGFADGHVEALDPRTLGFDIFNLQFGTTSGPTNTSNLVGARALDLFYNQ